ncbi:MAG: 16S rRNA (uracil(1498)-N(3))-methyltransferase [Candidatus Pacebacteria bacterium]|nr:16S rRNA (uracil(1498)-N(3))-methyltransferase [Candidatus Paceibacterota bacterium]MCF7862902.1 16S rRNA (uracil(1498)-N(3))-methyltransferase [Candidatus Paceibacterota bacterium]
MKIHRFIGDYNLNKDFITITDLSQVKQIKNVLKLNINEHIFLSDGMGKEIEAEIQNIQKEQIMVKKVVEIITEKENKKVNLYLAILKKENFELAVQKAVECGVSEITPILTKRTIKTGIKKDRLEKIIKEACEQSGRNIIPKINEITTFENALQEGQKNDRKVIFHFSKEEYSNIPDIKSIAIFIGPEGGFTDTEISFAREQKYEICSLGDHTLRAETACIVGSYLACH